MCVCCASFVLNLVYLRFVLNFYFGCARSSNLVAFSFFICFFHFLSLFFVFAFFSFHPFFFCVVLFYWRLPFFFSPGGGAFFLFYLRFLFCLRLIEPSGPP